jgi:membrane-bound ClpP family serine protease
MDKRKFAFGKSNYILLLVGVIAIIIGFVLMCGPGSTETHFEPDIFSVRRIKVAPTICFFGFLFVVYAILHKSKKDK